MSRLWIAMYHYVRDFANSAFPQLKGMDVAAFRQQILFFQEHFAPVTMEQVIDAALNGRTLPENALLLTFDDGYTDHYETVFPVLKSCGLRGSFFIPGQSMEERRMLDVNRIQLLFACAKKEDLVRDTKTLMDEYRGQMADYPATKELYETYAVPNRFDDKDIRFVKHMLQTVLPIDVRRTIIDRLFDTYVKAKEKDLAEQFYMSREQMMEMHDAGMFIGVHGYTHGWLADMAEEERRDDLMKSLDVLEDVIDRDRWVMNYPYGNCSVEAAQTAKSLGACLGITVEARAAEVGIDDPMMLPRLDCNDFLPVSDRYLQLVTAAL